MNIFVLDSDPIKAAQLQCDTHIVKMPTESAQMLSVAQRILDGTKTITKNKSGRKCVQWLFNDCRDDIFYKTVHYNHPCTVWSTLTSENYLWHYRHFIALCDEYKYRYGREHLADTKLRVALSNLPKNIPIGGLTPQPLAMNTNPECMFPDVVQSYRAFYQTKQSRFSMSWSKRPVPNWFTKKEVA